MKSIAVSQNLVTVGVLNLGAIPIYPHLKIW